MKQLLIFLSHPAWQGIGAVVAFAGLILAVVPLLHSAAPDAVVRAQETPAASAPFVPQISIPKEPHTAPMPEPVQPSLTSIADASASSPDWIDRFLATPLPTSEELSAAGFRLEKQWRPWWTWAAIGAGAVLCALGEAARKLLRYLTQ
ncbi:hypothetical protein [Pararobbsia silviterrae]|uniref:hypothetical protein n=1 Tax=Pararobbsia silviterrae TaxID=1792498 RepID=UPI0011C3C4F4|nr:hypothetical protein [Pararobbsia silviterrae]